MIKLKENKDSINKKEITILFIFFIVALLWSIFVPTLYAPDEAMRYPVPKYIYNHNKLPLPDDPEVIHPFYNASYAYYPLLLGSVVSSIFMKIVGFLGVGELGLLISARLVSVLSGTAFVYFLIKISKRLFDKRAHYFAICLGAFIPQFIFLSCYVNNDSIALAASSMIVLAWIYGIQDGWNFKNSLLLAIGIIICALSYYNAYAWILMSVVLFICTFFNKKSTESLKDSEKKKDKNKEDNNKIKFDYKNMFKYGIFIAIIVLIGISFFFIRNFIVNKGDLLGMKSFMEACEEGAEDFLKPSLRDTPKNNGIGYLEMLKSTKWTGGSMNWRQSTIKSFICMLGPMRFSTENWVYTFYKLLFVVGLIGMIIAFILKTKKNPKMKMFYLCLVVCAIIPILLSIQYSYATDYQAQGRYVYPMFMALIIFTVTGIQMLLEIIEKIIGKFIKNDKFNMILEIIVYTVLSLVILYIMFVLANRLMITTIGVQ